jgi:solute carrier family 35 (UDP-sugar transporter), member A1/2/3
LLSEQHPSLTSGRTHTHTDTNTPVLALSSLNMRQTTDKDEKPGMTRRALLNTIVFCLLAFQTAGHSLTMRYVRGERGEKFDSGVAVLCMEIIKVIICIIVLIATRELPLASPLQVIRSLWYMISTSYALAVPAGTYFIQNSLQFVALSNLDSGTHAVLSQLKLLTAGVFTVVLLRRQLSANRWRALVLLMAGVSLMLHAASKASSSDDADAITDADADADVGVGVGAGVGVDDAAASVWTSQTGKLIKGTLACLMIASCSGFAGVYFEMMVKSSAHVSLWVRNFQMAIYSVAFGIAQILLYSNDTVWTHGPLHDFSIWTWVTITFGVVGGLLVALLLKYTDTIVKGFASSAGVVLTVFGSWYLFGTQLNLQVGTGVCAVLFASYKYASDKPAPVKTPQKAGLNL